MNRPRITTEDELRQYEANVRKIKSTVGGGVEGHVGKGRRAPASNQSCVSGMKPVSSPAPSPKSPYRSKWEAAFANKLELEKHAGLIKQWWYEPFSLWLPGGVRYRPDFLVHYPDRGGPGISMPLIEVIEVKGWSKNRRDGITRLKIAAALFPCFVWRMVYRTKGGGWDGEYL